MLPPDFRVRDTSHLGIAALAEATNATFAEYFMPVVHTATGFSAFCRWFSIDTAQSVLLEHEDGRLAGLTMLATRGDRAWCGGFGIVPEFRGRGLSVGLADALSERARSLGLRSLQLEVLTQNERAVKAYQRAGLTATRELVILTGDAAPLHPNTDAALDVRPAAPEDAWTCAAVLPAPAPCWQREAVSVLGMPDLRAWVARRDGQVQAALICRRSPPSGPISLLSLPFAEEDAARALLGRAVAEIGVTQFFLLNEPQDSPLLPVLQSLGLRETNRQYEMRLAFSRD